MLRCIHRHETDPHFNLAAEEYFLKSALMDTIMIWRNEPSVIIGKHQNTSREINHSFIELFNLPVVRRITGGGSVYHDLGNINFSYIYSNRKENLIDFEFFTRPIILFLHELGLSASFEGKNNIVVDGLKVSGNSAHIHRNKVLHHGTLLFNTDLEKLEAALASHDDYYKDKSVRSIRSKVANIYGLLEYRISVEDFINLFKAFITKNSINVYFDELNAEENEAIRKLGEEKYKLKQWNYGYSPDYKFENEWMIRDQKHSVELHVKEGMIIQCKITGHEKNTNFFNEIAKQLTGILHEKKSVTESLKKLTFADENMDRMKNYLIQSLF